jgi:ketosteroid isomerase-like protein
MDARPRCVYKSLEKQPALESKGMSTRLPCIAVSLLSLCGCAATPAPAQTSPATNAADEQAVLQLEHDWCEAFRTGNADAVARIEDDDYVLTTSRAELSTKADDIAEIRAHTIEYSKYENREQQVRLYGDTAVVTGVADLEGISGDKPFRMNLRFTDTLLRRGAQWKAVAAQLTKIHD